ncbi:Receptor protein kinase [Thalictrum thalictroides]|uniref:Receptor protein kinase n=1 Tax=Thalictrum thalictroides TaxID=46969 RepID=A0A7J6V3V9_THATH|nr:Receptor protein kinase [Thalictrum thalictroides]
MVTEGRELRIEYSFLRKVAGVPTKFKYKDLETATDNFQAVLGRGSSAAVFKGILDDGTPIAVKRIAGVEHGEKEFKAEVSAIASVQHVNLVQLFGYCSVPGGPRLLVYQFVPNGSLGSWIFKRRASTNSFVVQSAPFSCLPWELSYGMVLLELVGGRRNVQLVQEGDNNRDRKWSYFPKIVNQKLREGNLMEVVDERLLVEGREVDERRVRILVHVALWCIQENPKLRPNMSRVVDMLEERVTVDSPPEPGITLLGLLEAPDSGERTGASRHIENQPACSYSYALSVLSGR